ncbi:MAG: penicillin-binding protein 2 [bacterium]
MDKFFKPLHHQEHPTDPFALPQTNLKKFRPKAKPDLSWLEDSFTPAVGGPVQAKTRYLGSAFQAPKLMAVLFFIWLGLLLLLARTAYLQAVKGDYYHQLAEGNRLRINYIKSPRGVIYSRELTPLVRNISSFSLYLTPLDLPREEPARQELLAELARITGQATEEIKSRLAELPTNFFRQIVIKENISYEEAVKLKIKSERLPGVNLAIDSRRDYLAGSLSWSHLLGYQGQISPEELAEYPDYLFDDQIGKTGLELFYEDVLRGQYGREEIEVDALGKRKKLLAQEPQQPGNSLVLTIDAELQTQTEKILQQVLLANNKRRGAVVALNPNNGEVLALVSWPGYDNKLFAQKIDNPAYQKYLVDPDKPLFNRAISGEYPSGSVFKPIVAAAALQAGVITPTTGFNSVGGVQIDKWFFPDWKAGGHGWTDVRKALADSVNTFFYYIGGGDNKNMPYLGVNKIVEYAKMFGLSSETGLDLPGERPGFLPTMKWKETAKNEPWYIGDTYHLAIGQGDLLVTPLQVAAYTSVFANGGTYYQPHLVKEILDIDGQVIKDVKPKIINHDFISPEYLQVANEGLRQAVVSGSAQALGDLPVKTAGKTGTAQWSNQESSHAWFTGFAPYGQPEIVVTVIIEEGGEGSAVALPVAKEIWRWWFSRQITNNE